MNAPITDMVSLQKCKNLKSLALWDMKPGVLEKLKRLLKRKSSTTQTNPLFQDKTFVIVGKLPKSCSLLVPLMEENGAKTKKSQRKLHMFLQHNKYE